MKSGFRHIRVVGDELSSISEEDVRIVRRITLLHFKNSSDADAFNFIGMTPQHAQERRHSSFLCRRWRSSIGALVLGASKAKDSCSILVSCSNQRSSSPSD